MRFLLSTVAMVALGVGLLVLIAHESEVWRDPPNTPCLRWQQHREGHDVYVKGIHSMSWRRVHYCQERSVNPDASVYEDAR
jgi:hypothetical protein